MSRDIKTVVKKGFKRAAMPSCNVSREEMTELEFREGKSDVLKPVMFNAANVKDTKAGSHADASIKTKLIKTHLCSFSL